MKTGKAYGFFDCKASKEEIEAELPTLRDLAQTPSELELSLTENPSESLMVIARASSEGDSFNHEYDSVVSAIKDGKDLTKNFSRFARLVQLIDIGKGSGVRYAMEATYPNATNKKTADELSAILNQTYQALYEKGEEFRGEIVYKEKGEYIFRE